MIHHSALHHHQEIANSSRKCYTMPIYSKWLFVLSPRNMELTTGTKTGTLVLYTASVLKNRKVDCMSTICAGVMVLLTQYI